MKIVTYNVNGLRSRVSQHGSLLKLLNSLEADIICLQETKLSRQELTTDLTMAEGYEAFFSCTRTSNKGRIGYSGVATFCRVNSAFSSNEVALPLAAEEGFTGLLEQSKREYAPARDFLLEVPVSVEGLEGITKVDLLKVDSEGRCLITDHGHFILFNLYGPRAQCDDAERVQFKLTFFKALQKRWEYLLSQGKRVFVVGDLNIAPAAIDCWNVGPDFEENTFRKWLRSLLVESRGPFFDVFRAKHPERKDSYTCWAQHNGVEEFNYGSRIDHILIAGPCIHQNNDIEGHNIVDCHVKECDILTQFKRWKPGNIPRWKGGRSTKLEGSDHAPVYVCLAEMPNLPVHNTPPLAARYVPEVRGWQQTIVSLLQKRKEADGVKNHGESNQISNQNVKLEDCSENSNTEVICINEDMDIVANVNGEGSTTNGLRSETTNLASPCFTTIKKKARQEKYSQRTSPCFTTIKKKARQEKYSQRTLRSFFQSNKPSSSVDVDIPSIDISKGEPGFSRATDEQNSIIKVTIDAGEENGYCENHLNINRSSQGQGDTSTCSSEKEESSAVLLEWQRIQKLMQKSVPLCKGHGEPCVARSVKKAGPNVGRGFYVCARPEGLSSNPDATCNHFEWASSKSRRGG